MAISSSEYKKLRKSAVEYRDTWWREAKEDFRFYALKQWSSEDINELKDKGRPALTFDRTRPIIDSVAGTQVTSRWEPKFMPRDTDPNEPDAPFSESTSSVLKWARQRANMDHQESSMFHSTIVCGVGCTGTTIDYEEDPDGKIVKKRVPIKQMAVDPSSVEPNFIDAKHLFRDRWVDIDDVTALFGKDKLQEILRLAAGAGNDSSDDFIESLSDDTWETDYNNSSDDFYDKSTGKIKLVEFQRWTRKYFTRLYLPPELAEATGLPMEEFVEKGEASARIQSLTEAIDALNIDPNREGMPPVPDVGIVENFPVKTFWRSFYVGDTEIQEEQKIECNRFTYEFTTCFEDWSDDNRRYFFGLMRPMRDPQQYANKFFSHAVHIWSSNPKGVLIVENGFFENFEEAMKQWSDPNGVILAEDGALSQTAKPRYEIVRNNVSMRGIESLLSHAIASIAMSAGINEAYFAGGAGDLRRTAATSISQIKEQNLTQIAGPFDSLRLYKKRDALLTMSFFKKYFREETALRILGNNTEFVSEIMSDEPLERQFDVVVEEVPSDPNRQMEVFRSFMETNFIPQLMDLNIPIPPSIAKFFPIPSDTVREFEVVLRQVYEMSQMKMELSKLEMEIQKQQMMMGVAGPPENPGGGPGNPAPPEPGA